MLGSWALRLLPIIFGTKHYLISAQLMITNDLLTHVFLDRRFFWGREIPPTPEQRVLAELANFRAEWAERGRSWWAERAEWVEKEKGWVKKEEEREKGWVKREEEREKRWAETEKEKMMMMNLEKKEREEEWKEREKKWERRLAEREEEWRERENRWEAERRRGQNALIRVFDMSSARTHGARRAPAGGLGRGGRRLASNPLPEGAQAARDRAAQ